MEPIKGYTRSGQTEAVGLFTYTCAICGKEFESTSQHAYKIVKKNKARMYCSYKHFRIDDEKEREAYKQSLFGRWMGKDCDATEEDKAQKRVDSCRANLEKAQQKKDGEYWETATYKQRKWLLKRIADWKERLAIAEKELEEAKLRDEQAI